ncbi:MAG TPA: hypothetical protein GX715_00330 [Armatimonadetes bacterium]|nr:hypothetical protein [Armatimonadota bacterium]
MAKRLFLCLGAAAALVWLTCAALRPYLLDREEVAAIRRLSAEVAAVEAQNDALRRRIAVLKTPKGIEVEARRLGWVQPGEILIQTSEEPPPPPASDPETADKPPLGAVQAAREGGFLRQTLERLSRALRHERPVESRPGKP